MTGYKFNAIHPVVLSCNHCKPNGVPLSTYSIVLHTYLAQNRPDDGHMPAKTCCLKR